MEILDILKKFKQMNPDADYTKRSRSFIVETPFVVASPLTSPWRAFMQSLQFGSAIALVGATVILIVGGFSSWKFLSPFRMANLDIATLRAEAEAVSMQVELTDINYRENNKPPASASVSTPATATTKKVVSPQISAAAEELGLTPATSSESLSIEEALDKLSE
ncbi:MAG TPA: hypothetical protein VJL32_02295 [Candidatus Paceibacterota bacterium]